MIAIAALALGLTAGPGPDFSEAYERAKRYAADKNGVDFVDKTFFPKVGDQIQRAMQDCKGRAHPMKNTFVIALPYPDSPVPDFAEDLEITMDY